MNPLILNVPSLVLQKNLEVSELEIQGVVSNFASAKCKDTNVRISCLSQAASCHPTLLSKLGKALSKLQSPKNVCG